MTSARLRIRSVRMKSGGAKLEIFRNPTADYLNGWFRADTQAMYESVGQNLAGYALVGWGADGKTFGVSRVGNGSVVPAVAVPQFAKDMLLLNRADQLR